MLNAEQQALRETVAEFAHEVVAPVIAEHYENHTFPYEVVRQMGKLGLFGLPFPSEYGGMGGDYLALCVAIEELARVDSSVAITLEAAVNAVYANKIAALPEDERPAFVAAKREEYERDIDIVRLASELVIDAVVAPGDLRAELVRRFAAARGKDRHFSRRRHGVTPV